MFANQLELSPSIWKTARLMDLCNKLIPRPGHEETNVPLRNDLERLALSAPHLLSDIGFERDARACSREKVVWRRGDLCVIIANSGPKATVTLGS